MSKNSEPGESPQPNEREVFKHSFFEGLEVADAAERLKKIVVHTPLMLNENLSAKYHCNVFLKREDLQVVRSYKLRGAYNLLSSISEEERAKGVVCASAGNHAQGFAYSCKKLKCKGIIFMPVITPRQKIKQTKMFGEGFVQIKLTGDTFDKCSEAALAFTSEHGMTFIPPFDHQKIIEGQATVGLEILEDLSKVDYLFVPVGGGGLASGVSSYFHTFSPSTKIVGIEPQGAASMSAAFEQGKPVELQKIDTFVDGASVTRVGNITYQMCKEFLSEMHVVPEGKVCTSILQLYNENAIVAEPAGALSIAALDDYASEIKGKNVVCIISGGNNDIDRMQEIKERSLQFEGLKHYFLIRFAQRPGALKQFVSEVLGPHDDIARFEYIKKNNKEAGPALVGIELTEKKDYAILKNNLDKFQVNYKELKSDEDAFGYLV
ncbi:MAG: threonine ammonia-lyase IlvA [Bacteroidetes bacterium]|nr:threonine ammonia-lyase IlvA [Bacteroidota bacterium]